jgi:branched-chain amino acid transport system permease protein
MWTVQLLNSLAFAALLFLACAGFSLIFGLMRIPNMAHGAMFLLGGYLGVAAIRLGLPFWAAVACGGVTVALLGWIIDALLLVHLRRRESAEVLVTIGVSLVIANVSLLIWGGDPLRFDPPDAFVGSLRVGHLIFPKYRLVLIAMAVALGGLLYLLIERTRIGAMVRAAVDDRDMARAVGIRVTWIFTGIFCLSCFFVGAAGVLAVPTLSVFPGLDGNILLLSLIVVIVGGAGSLIGAMIGSIVVGLLYTFGPILFPDLAYAALFLPMAIVLAIFPNGIFGKQAS